jgi:chaperonin GroES
VEGATSEQIFLNNQRINKPLRPLGNQVLVRLRRAEAKTGGGLYMPTAESEQPKEGTVVAAGPGRMDKETGELMPCPVVPGDVVLLSQYTGESVDYNGQKHMFVDAETLLGKFADEKVTVSGFTPLGDRVLLETAEKATETTTGIALALDEDEDGNMGEAVAVGAGKYYRGELKPVGISVGETVMYAPRTGLEATIDGRRFTIVGETDCVAKW